MHFKNLAAFAARFLKSDHFGTLCIKGLKKKTSSYRLKLKSSRKAY